MTGKLAINQPQSDDLWCSWWLVAGGVPQADSGVITTQHLC